jgi:quercetin dioxygenase-like cupin family protein
VPLDPKVNIQIAPLASDQAMTMYATVLKAGSKVTAHVHQEGVELHHILRGSGEIYIGQLGENQQVHWNQPKIVNEGDVSSIEPDAVHQLKNTSSMEDLVLIFVCPHTHLKGDRVITVNCPHSL